jgi:ATP-dependent RNA helicase DHX8/PRP22
MEVLEKLKHFQLLSKILMELESHLGLAEKDLAEYIISMAADCADATEFHTKLSSEEEFPSQLSDTLFKFIRLMRKKPYGSFAELYTHSNREQHTITKERVVDLNKVVGNTDYNREPERDSVVLTAPATEKKQTRDDWRDREDRKIGRDDDREERDNRNREREDRDRGRDDRGYRGRDDSRDRGRDERDYRGRDDRGRDDRGYRGRDDRDYRSRGDRDERDYRGRDDRDYRGRDDRDREYRRRDDYRDDDRDRDRYQERRGYRPRSRSGSRGRRSPDRRSSNALDPEPVVGKIYEGRVSSLQNFGCFVALVGVRGRREGLVHKSQLTNGRVNDPSEIVHVGQMVKVKVKFLTGRKIELSMKDVDQATGQDLNPEGGRAMVAKRQRDSDDEGDVLSEIGLPPILVHETKKKKVRKSSPSRKWEENIVRNAFGGSKRLALDSSSEDEEISAESELEDVDVELNRVEPTFLVGQLERARELSPTRILKNPEGSLSRIATTGSALQKERREMREEQRRALLNQAKPEKTKTEDPFATDVRYFFSKLI